MRDPADLRLADRDDPPDELRVRRTASGTSVRGPDFYVWDSVHVAASSWARQLDPRRLDRQHQESASRPRAGQDASRLRPTREGGELAPDAERDSSALRRRLPHVLVAEDDADFRRLVVEALREGGYQVTQCIDGPDLVSKLGTYLLFGPPVGFDLVVSDVRMPGASALEIVEAMRDCEGVPPVILITGFPSEETRTAALQLGVAAIFAKPFEMKELLAAAGHLVSGRPGDAS